MRSMSIVCSILVLCVSWWAVSGSNLVSELRNDANLDLSMDDEYEDLRAELLAYHTAFASLAAAQRGGAVGPETEGRRSLGSTPCWDLGGICIKKDLCTVGNRYLTEVAGCRANLQVCCFSWNNFILKDMTAHGISNQAFPWSLHKEFGGEGIKMHSAETSDKDDKSNIIKYDKDEENGLSREVKTRSEEEKDNQSNDAKFLNSEDKRLSDDEGGAQVNAPEKVKHHLGKRKRKRGGRPLAIIIKT